ncbi:Ydc2-catalyt-domain-containing protein [Daldinia caldariorum]|uniref:Ydc2-catalyt-domain-containing protein n=1 Tax=Daldinia caldariorum TaxID=326644 RepID=UPI00200790BA|nr:Ydc2-catalyt-domain-containing protein [Daldinia caldariorum]KAI1471232.1 Ydc2-catalyt-domain-containing protein [Daldinia caldariorum]
MSSKLEALLPKFKAVHLKQLASLCGDKTTGRKSDLVERLVALSQAAKPKRPATKDSRLVLSIDLGIRNLGFSLISLAAPSKPLSPRTLTVDDLRRPPPVRLHRWQRRELLPPLEDGVEDPDRYSPASLAVATDRLVRHDLLPLKPTHVLIERQRWRSHGAAAVQEWTLRVNTLEAMLHATFRTLKELGHWDGEMVPMAPNRVTRFWPPPPGLAVSEEAPKKKRSSRAAKEEKEEKEEEVEVEEEDEAVAEAVKGKTRKTTKSAKSSQNSKKLKIGVLTGWLAETGKSEIIQPANGDMENAVAWVRSKLSRTGKGKRKSSSTTPDVGDLIRGTGSQKLDDLTDCLLQGVTWLKWEENKATLLREDAVMRLLEAKLLDQLEDSTLLDES